MIVQIAEGLFLGNLDAVRHGEYQQHGITAIICVNENNEREFPPSSNDVNYLWCSFNDPGDTLTDYKLMQIEAFARISFDSGQNLLVHCMGGANRSSVVMAHIVASISAVMDFDGALAFVKQQNHNFNPREELLAKYREIVADVFAEQYTEPLGTGNDVEPVPSTPPTTTKGTQKE